MCIYIKISHFGELSIEVYSFYIFEKYIDMLTNVSYYVNVKNIKKNTKELIFETAILLFAEQGYKGTSIRQIARKVGIKESSIYNHYEGKRDILDSILDFQLKSLETSLVPESEMDINTEELSDPVDFWIAGSIGFLKNRPPLSESISRILNNEMYLDEKCRQFVLYKMFKAEKEMTKKILSYLHSNDKIIDCNLDQISAEYVYMIHGLEKENNLMLLEGRTEEEINKRLLEQMALFIGRLRKE